jgi:DNA invertase Pin-like site-specific DNA recombinase
MIVVRGFCRNTDQEAGIVAYGVPARDVYMADRGAESLEHCLSSFRGRPGILILAQDCRAFGDTRREVAEIMARLEKAKIGVIDLTHREDVTVAQLLARANDAIAHNHFVGDRQKARRRGRKGGKANGEAAAAKREDARRLLDRIVDCWEIPWKLKARVTGISKATLRRQYGANATAQRA